SVAITIFSPSAIAADDANSAMTAAEAASVKRLEIRILILSVEGARVLLFVRALSPAGRAARLGRIIDPFSPKNQLVFRRHSAPFPRQFLRPPLVRRKARPISPVNRRLFSGHSGASDYAFSGKRRFADRPQKPAGRSRNNRRDTVRTER